MPSGQGRQARLPFLAPPARAQSLALFFPATDTADKIGIERKRIADYSALNPCWPVETGGAEAASLRMTGRSHTIAPDRSFFCAGQCRKCHYSGGSAIFYV